MYCLQNEREYNIYGYKGKQVRDNIHSYDLVRAFDFFHQDPKTGEVYNMGGGRNSSCSLLEAIELCEQAAEKRLKHSYIDRARVADHIWYISDTRKFKEHYPAWQQRFTLSDIINDLLESTKPQ